MKMTIIVALTILTNLSSASAEVFKIQPAFVLNYDCGDNFSNCTDEVIIPQSLEIELLENQGTWEQTYNFSGVDYQVNISVTKNEASDSKYSVFGFIAAYEKSNYENTKNAYIHAMTKTAESLNSLSTGTMDLQTNEKYHSIWMNLEPVTSAKSKQQYLEMANKQRSVQRQVKK